MLTKIVKSVFGDANDRILKKEQPLVKQINALEEKYQALSDKDLKAQTKILQDRLKKGETEDQILTDAFAVVRESAKRTLGQRHYDVQLLGGIMMHRGYIIEMKTGEGKTLVATLAVYLNALSGKGVHVVTVNDYLAERDSNWMGQVYRFLGLTCGCIINQMDDDQRRTAYANDITYGTNNEFGFDYLRDNMKFKSKDMVQRAFNFAIVDEVDSILIDEARTPLIISGAAEDSSELYQKINTVIPQFKAEHYIKDEKDRNVMLTDKGVEFAEQILTKAGIMTTPNLYDISNASVLHHLDQALHAHLLYQLDVHYLVRDNQLYLIDEFTGRVMEGRRFSGGLHQALEAKEGVHIQQENQTLASITYQNYFRMYPKLAGMTGTALTEATEFAEIYQLNCVSVPTNKPIARKDYDDEIYRTATEKYRAIAAQIKEAHDRGQPILVGTVSIEKSEYLASLLQKEYGIKNIQVLNAKFHENEAKIVAQAGSHGAITIATNMAGRGTDIQLGGNLDMRVAQELGENPTDKQIAKIKAEIETDKEAVLAAGGLYVIGTERHESRRIDNQLRGRSGRQGDPGASRFYLSLEDDLMRIFGSERLDSILRRFGLKEDEAITHPWVSRALEKAQQKVEARNFEIRKNLLKYDDIINEQRKAIYAKRHAIMESDDMSGDIDEMVREVVEQIMTVHVPYQTAPEEWNAKGMDMACRETLGLSLPIDAWLAEEAVTEQIVFNRVLDKAMKLLSDKRKKYQTIIKSVEKSILLETLDTHWKDHLSKIDHLRRTIGLQSYAQKDPLHEYKKEAFRSFEQMMYMISEQTILYIFKMEFSAEDLAFFENRMQPPTDIQEEHAAPEQLIGGGEQQMDGQHVPFRHESGGAVDPKNPRTWGKVSRNQVCPCGSGKKFKHCHGKLG